MRKRIAAAIAAAAIGLAGCSQASDASTSGTPVVEEKEVTATPTQTPTPTESADPGDIEGWKIDKVDYDLDAADVIASANQFNDPPTGQYVLVTITATNTWGKFNDLSFLNTQLMGSDKKVYDESSQTTPFDMDDVPDEAAPGGTVQTQVVFDVPAEALGAGAAVLLGYDRVIFPIA